MKKSIKIFAAALAIVLTQVLCGVAATYPIRIIDWFIKIVITTFIFFANRKMLGSFYTTEH